MKNTSALLLVGVIGMGLAAGCQKSDEGTGEPTPTPAAGTDKMGTDPKMGATDGKTGTDSKMGGTDGKMGVPNDKMGATPDKMSEDKKMGGGH